MKNLGKIFYGIIAIIIGSIVNAFVISKLWAWLLVPSFNIESITMGTAFGISVILGFFRSKKTDDDDEDVVEKITKALVWSFVNALFYLLIGWIGGMFI